ncbi:DNA cytosine methyltransferase [Pimelobacter simplex]|uniref:DNA cytosine methyltransferase n=1 Tax=Nocardioides simplex TaxID=2045 RepID=UPI0038075B46
MSTRRTGSFVSRGTAAQASEPAFRFIDLFAGVGGFHAALSAYGGQCVYAVEIDKAAAGVYKQNWGHDPLGDITKDANDEVMNVGSHEILAAGFPCQPFSKSGAQKGMDETRGTLYWNILRIIQERRPKIVLLENVRNLAGPRHLHEWQIIIETLRDEGYRVSETPAIFSPHLLPPDRGGRPQVRERVFITATLIPDSLADSPELALDPGPVASISDRVDGWEPKAEWHLEDLLDDSHNIPGCDLTEAERRWIDAWDEFVQIMWELREGRRLPGFPLWADSWRDVKDAWKRDKEKVPDVPKIPSIDPTLPDWKRSHLIKNYEFFAAHHRIIRDWAERWGVYTSAFPPSRRKLEWQAQDTPRLWDAVMHLRPSGIRAKAPNYLPALVAITQTSIVGPRERRLSPRETARMQGLPDTFVFGDQRPAATYKQMGNGVNVGVVWHVLREHVRRDEWLLKHSAEGRRIVDAVLEAPASPDAILAQHQPKG